MISNSHYQDLAKSDAVVTMILQIIYRYSDIVSVCSLVSHLRYTHIDQLPIRTIKPTLTITARALSQYKYPYRSLPSPSWIMLMNSDLGNKFLFWFRDIYLYQIFTLLDYGHIEWPREICKTVAKSPNQDLRII